MPDEPCAFWRVCVFFISRYTLQFYVDVNIRRTKENTACNTNQKTIRVLYGGMRVTKEYCKSSSFYGL